MFSTQARIALLIFGVVNAVVFGVGVVVVLAVPDLAAQAAYLIPVVVVASLVVSPFISWWLAPRMRARFGRRAPDRKAPAAL